MAIGADGRTPHLNGIRYGFVLVAALMVTSGCVNRIESPNVPIPAFGSQVAPISDGNAAAAPSAPAIPDTTHEEPFDPFAKPGEAGLEEYDPWEPLNSKVFEFNRQFDRWLLKPVAT